MGDSSKFQKHFNGAVDRFWVIDYTLHSVISPLRPGHYKRRKKHARIYRYKKRQATLFDKAIRQFMSFRCVSVYDSCARRFVNVHKKAYMDMKFLIKVGGRKLKEGTVQPILPPYAHNKVKQRAYFLEHCDEILSTFGKDLETLAYMYNVDKNLPIQEKQEQVVEAMATRLGVSISEETKWTKNEIVLKKQHFLETLEKLPLFELCCYTLKLKPSMVRLWMRSDPDFAEGIRNAQLRSGQRLYYSMYTKAIEGDFGAQMFLIKSYGEAVKLIEPMPEQQVAGANAVGSDELMADVTVDNLSVDEQETLLRLMRKAKNGTEEYEPTQFIEDETPNQPALTHENTIPTQINHFNEEEDKIPVEENPLPAKETITYQQPIEYEEGD